MGITIEWSHLRKLLSYNKPKEIMEMSEVFYFGYPDMFGRFTESISNNQIKSKDTLFGAAAMSDVKPLVRNHEGNKITIEIIGGWFGWPLLDYVAEYFKDYEIKIRFFEIDPFAIKIAKEWQAIKNSDLDITFYGMNWFDFTAERRAHVIINTSCEHMPDLITAKKYIVEPERTTLFLTSNDKTDEPDHVNCKETATQLAEDNGLKVLHGESINLRSGNDFYNRHIVIGRWK